MQFQAAPEPETRLQKIQRIATDALWVIGTSAFVLLFPIYVATKL
jgi:hypothetical protein